MFCFWDREGGEGRGFGVDRDGTGIGIGIGTGTFTWDGSVGRECSLVRFGLGYCGEERRMDGWMVASSVCNVRGYSATVVHAWATGIHWMYGCTM